jgi:hypothetical protein
VQITFPSIEAWDSARMVVSFPADYIGNRIICAVSLEALQDNFGGNATAPMECFKANRQAIQSRAAALITKHRYESDGSVLIRTSDGR